MAEALAAESHVAGEKDSSVVPGSRKESEATISPMMAATGPASTGAPSMGVASVTEKQRGKASFVSRSKSIRKKSDVGEAALSSEDLERIKVIKVEVESLTLRVSMLENAKKD